MSNQKRKQIERDIFLSYHRDYRSDDTGRYGVLTLLDGKTIVLYLDTMSENALIQFHKVRLGYAP